MKIKVTKNGPYVLIGSIPMKEEIISKENGVMVYQSSSPLPNAAQTHLCRCGASKNAPYCDGTHAKIGFIGTETASRDLYVERAEFLPGNLTNLLDDHRCAIARFCHKRHGTAWELVSRADTDALKQEAIAAAVDCPAGRLTALTKSNQPYEYAYIPEVVVAQDQDKGCSAGIFVRGNIPLESADGQPYEKRNRYTLCRCGHSKNKPFCDGTHLSIQFKDKIK
ncbi:MAG: zinc finger CDGSH-type protein [Bacillales bacterium]|jgi:CDGSH-type Zn-finger protein|nr:zinc finger CDGSH-type protein [Bacillales bacterium]